MNHLVWAFRFFWFTIAVATVGGIILICIKPIVGLIVLLVTLVVAILVTLNVSILMDCEEKWYRERNELS